LCSRNEKEPSNQMKRTQAKKGDTAAEQKGFFRQAQGNPEPTRGRQDVKESDAIPVEQQKGRAARPRAHPKKSGAAKGSSGFTPSLVAG